MEVQIQEESLAGTKQIVGDFKKHGKKDNSTQIMASESLIGKLNFA